MSSSFVSLVQKLLTDNLSLNMLFVYLFVALVAMTPGDTQDLYKENMKVIIDRWRENNALRDPDVDWVSCSFLFNL